MIASTVIVLNGLLHLQTKDGETRCQIPPETKKEVR